MKSYSEKIPNKILKLKNLLKIELKKAKNSAFLKTSFKHFKSPKMSKNLKKKI